MKAKKKEIKELKLADMGLSEAEVGKSAAKVKRILLSEPEAAGHAEILEGDAKAIAAQLITKLKERKVFN